MKEKCKKQTKAERSKEKRGYSERVGAKRFCCTSKLGFLQLICKASLKLVSVIFYQIFISHEMIALQNYEKCFLFHFKSSFCSQDIQVFVFPPSPLFLPVSHCFRGWWKINLKVCDVINCLNKNLITHFVWYLKKEKSYDIETLSIDRVLYKKHFYWKIMQKMCTRGYSQTPF